MTGSDTLDKRQTDPDKPGKDDKDDQIPNASDLGRGNFLIFAFFFLSLSFIVSFWIGQDRTGKGGGSDTMASDDDEEHDDDTTRNADCRSSVPQMVKIFSCESIGTKRDAS